MIEKRNILKTILFRFSRIRNLVRISLSDCVNIGGFSYGQQGNHPLIRVFSEFDQNTGFDYTTSSLVDFYAKNQFQNFPVLFCKSNSQNENERSFIPPWGGGKVVNVHNEFEHWIGPKTNEEIDCLLTHLHTIYQVVKEGRFHPLLTVDGFIRVHKLAGETKNKYLVVGGQKRSAILSHCGRKKVFALLQPKDDNYPGNMPAVINVKNVDRWANVVNHMYTREEAVEFFNFYMQA